MSGEYWILHGGPRDGFKVPVSHRIYIHNPDDPETQCVYERNADGVFEFVRTVPLEK